MHFVKARTDLQNRYKRTQALAALAFQMICAGVLPEIEMSAAYIVISEVLKQAGSIGLPDTDDVRNYERVTFIVESCVVLEAIDIVFDSEVSPIADGEKFDYGHMLLLAPYLRATTEHCVFALGFLSDQYESPIQSNVLQSLVEVFFERATIHESLLEDAGKENVSPDEEESMNDRWNRLNILDENYYICEYPPNSNAMPVATEKSLVAAPLIQAVSSNGKPPLYGDSVGHRPQQRAPRQHELDDRALVKQLSHELWHKMHPRPVFDEIRNVLEKLMTQLIPDKHSSSKGIPALYFRDGKMHISRHVYHQLRRNSLKSVVQDVVSKCITQPQTFVYGATVPDKPYVLQTLEIAPNTDRRRRLIVEDPNYFDDAVAKLSLNLCPSFNQNMDESRKIVFSSMPGYTVNCSVDWHACQRHLQRSGITRKARESLPDPLPSVMLQQVMENRRAPLRPLRRYHEWITQFDKDYKKQVRESKDSCELETVTRKRVLSEAFALDPDAPTALSIDTMPSADDISQPPPSKRSMVEEAQEITETLSLFEHDCSDDIDDE